MPRPKVSLVVWMTISSVPRCESKIIDPDHACQTARANREQGARYPHKRKCYRTTVWKASGMRVKDRTLLLARAKGLRPIRVPLPPWFVPATMRLLEARLVTQRVPGPLLQALYLASGG
jgi:hypothetical protein